MKYILFWFLVSPHGIHQLDGIPYKEFSTEAECKTFADSRIEITQLFKGEGGKVVYECYNASHPNDWKDHHETGGSTGK